MQSTKNMLTNSFRNILEDDRELSTLAEYLYSGKGYNINILDGKMSSETARKVKKLIEVTNRKRAELAKETLDKSHFDSLDESRKEQLAKIEEAIENIDKYLIAPINVSRAQEELKKSRGIFGRFTRFDKNIGELSRVAKVDFVPYNSKIIEDYREMSASSFPGELIEGVVKTEELKEGYIMSEEPTDEKGILTNIDGEIIEESESGPKDEPTI